MDRYGYIGIETLLNFCENSKDHAVTPNDFMRLKRVRQPEPLILFDTLQRACKHKRLDVYDGDMKLHDTCHYDMNSEYTWDECNESNCPLIKKGSEGRRTMKNFTYLTDREDGTCLHS